MVHHNSRPLTSLPLTFFYRRRKSKEHSSSRKPYGVPSPHRVLPQGVIFKRWRDVQAFFRVTMGLTDPERGVVSELVRLWMIKGEVYAKAKQVKETAKVSHRAFWHTIKRLEEMKMIQVVNRYVQREKAQISNLFLLEKLIFALARFLAECGERNLGPMMARFLALPGQEFWSRIWRVDNLWELVGNVRPIRAA